jgi:hypothetical protein
MIAARAAVPAVQPSRCARTLTTLVGTWRATTTSNFPKLSWDAGARPKTDQASQSPWAICRAFIRNSDASIRHATVTADPRNSDRRSNFKEGESIGDQRAGVDVISRHQVRHCPHWQRAFASQQKDHRYYEIVDDTIHPEFDYLYFAIRDLQGEVRAIQPFFVLDQDILVGVPPYFRRLIDAIRLQWPRFMYMKTIMVGCVAGEANLDDGDDSTRAANAEVLAGAIVRHARALGAHLIVLKEFPERYREVLSCFVRGGFTRIPSMPLTRLNIAYAGFEDYMQSALNSATRSKLRKKFRVTENDIPIELSVTNDITSIIREIYPL